MLILFTKPSTYIYIYIYTYTHVYIQQITINIHIQPQYDSATWGVGIWWSTNAWEGQVSHLWPQGCVSLSSHKLEWFLQARPVLRIPQTFIRRRDKCRTTKCSMHFEIIFIWIYIYMYVYTYHCISCNVIHLCVYTCHDAIKHNPLGTYNCTIVSQSLQDLYCLHPPPTTSSLPLPHPRRHPHYRIMIVE